MDLQTFQTQLGLAVGVRRRGRSLTQEQLAERVGSSPEWISQVERGVGNPSFALVVRIADALGVTPAQLVEEAWGGSARNQELAELVVAAEHLSPEAIRALVEMAARLRALLADRRSIRGDRSRGE